MTHVNAIIRPHGRRSVRAPAARAPNEYQYAELERLRALSLDDKIAWSRGVIRRALIRMSRPAVAFSAGKDSTVMLHLIHPLAPDVVVIYGNTTIEFPECIQFAHHLRDEWRLNYHEARPERSFWWVVENYGWPLMGKTFGVGGVAHKESREQFFDDLAARVELNGNYAIQAEVPISSACCTFLKERPSAKLQKALGVDGVFLGILASESRRRMFNFLQYGEWYLPKDGLWRCHPLAIWTDDDIWAYIRRYNVPYASLYDMGYYDDFGEYVCHKRNGCMFCGMDIRFKNNHLSIMRRTHPKIWDFLMKKKGLGAVLLALRFAVQHHQFDMFSQQADIGAYLERFPCAFDRI